MHLNAWIVLNVSNNSTKKKQWCFSCLDCLRQSAHYLPSEPTESTAALEVTEVHRCHHPRGTQLKKLCLSTSYSVGRTLSPAKWITPSNFCSANSLSTAWQSGRTAATLLRHLRKSHLKTYLLGAFSGAHPIFPTLRPKQPPHHTYLSWRTESAHEDSHHRHLPATKLQVICHFASGTSGASGTSCLIVPQALAPTIDHSATTTVHHEPSLSQPKVFRIRSQLASFPVSSWSLGKTCQIHQASPLWVLHGAFMGLCCTLILIEKSNKCSICY